MQREDFFPGISVFVFILLILTKFIKQAFAICISETRKLARRLSPPELVHWVSSGSPDKTGTCLEVQQLRLHAVTDAAAGSAPGWAAKIPRARATAKKSKSTSKQTNVFFKWRLPGLRVLFARSLEKGGTAVVQVRTHIPLQGQRAALGSSACFHASQASLRGPAPHWGRIRLRFSSRRPPCPLPASLSQVALRGSDFLKPVYGVSFLHFFRSQTLGSKNREGQELGTGNSAQEHRARGRPWPRVPLRSGSTRDAHPYPAARLPPGGGVARTRRHLGGLSRRSVYYSMVARSRPAPPQSLSGGAAAAAAPSLYKPAVPGCEWITMYLSGKPIIINVTPRGSQWWWSGGGGGWDTSKLGTSLRLYKRRRKKKKPTRFVWGKIITILCWYFFINNKKKLLDFFFF